MYQKPQEHESSRICLVPRNGIIINLRAGFLCNRHCRTCPVDLDGFWGQAWTETCRKPARKFPARPPSCTQSKHRFWGSKRTLLSERHDVAPGFFLKSPYRHLISERAPLYRKQFNWVPEGTLAESLRADFRPNLAPKRL